MDDKFYKYFVRKLKAYLAIKTGMVNHKVIVGEVSAGVEHSWVYYLMLLMSGLIALFGLLTNSVAVVIGAMLISPLMGPIISSGLALTIGDLPLARRAFRTIIVSVVLTIIISTFFTIISPLKEPTVEILSRVRPNIYDLFIAMLSGIVGAVALCTKRNYLVTATGVAVATAVIPPLSVVGYAIGTWHLVMALGGFLLFFTNFVAIVLTSYFVFFVMGFRTSHVETIQYSQRTRLIVIGCLLGLVSIPLVYTLVKDINKVNINKRLERVLKRNLDLEHVSRLTSYSYQAVKGGLQVRATVNTIRYIDKNKEVEIENELKEGLSVPADLYLEQVMVASEKIQAKAPSIELAAVATVPHVDTSAEISAKVGRLILKTEHELTAALAPFVVSDLRLVFNSIGEPLQVDATLQRDYPVGKDEHLLLTRLIERTLEMPVRLRINLAPLVTGITFTEDGRPVIEGSNTVSVIKALPGGPAAFTFVIGYEGAGNDTRASRLRAYLNELGVPSSSIILHKINRKKHANVISLRVLHR